MRRSIRAAARAAGAALAVLAAPSAAQVVVDATLPGSVPGQIDPVAGQIDIMADRGVTVGSNLFHSFSAFDVASGEAAVFQGPATLTNVLARITGPQASRIDGTVGSEIPGANVFLMNPNGIVFGRDAQLDVKGSFAATTASAIELETGLFSAADPASSSLSVEPPSAFVFDMATPASIRVEGAGLAVPAGQSLALIGGDLTISGRPGTEDGHLSAPGGRIDLASLASPGRVEIVDGPAPDLIVEAEARGEISLLDSALVNTSGIAPGCIADFSCRPSPGAGDVLIRGGRFVIDGSSIRTFTVGALDAGRIDIDLSGDLHAIERSSSESAGLFAGSGFLDGERTTFAQVEIQNVPLPGGGFNAIVVFLYAASDTDLAEIAAQGCQTGLCQGIEYRSLNAQGAAGDIRVQASGVELSSGAQITSTSLFGGAAGEIAVTAGETIRIEGAPERFAGSYDAIRGGIFSNGQGGSDAGAISVTARELSIDRFGVIVTEASGGDGRGGDISVEVDRLSIAGNGRIDSSTRGSGAGGSIVVEAAQSVSMTGRLDQNEFSGISSIAQEGATGAAGDIRVDAPVIGVSNGAAISTTSLGGGDAGTIDIRFSDTMRVFGGSITAEARDAFGGSIYLNGGPVRRQPDGSLSIEKPPGLTMHGELLHLVDARISTTVGEGVGDGGNIAIDPRFVVLDEGSRITANADIDDGGNIAIVTQVFVGDTRNIQATSNIGLDGVVEIVRAVQDVVPPLRPLDTTITDAAALLRRHCASRRAASGPGSLVVTGRDGIPATPDGYLPAAYEEEPRAGSVSGHALPRAPGEPAVMAIGCAS